MTGRQLDVDGIADVLLAHKWTFGGGTAVGAYWKCLCGQEGWARSGLRDHADALGALHVAEAVRAADQP